MNQKNQLHQLTWKQLPLQLMLTILHKNQDHKNQEMKNLLMHALTITKVLTKMSSMLKVKNTGKI